MATQRMTVNIRGMTSAGCVACIEQALRQQDGVIWATINFAASQATLTCDPATFRLARLSDTVRELGYDLQAATEPGAQSALPACAPGGRPVAAAGSAVLAFVGILILGFATMGALLTQYRAPLILLGLATALLGIGLSLRFIRQTHHPEPGSHHEPTSKAASQNPSRRNVIGD